MLQWDATHPYNAVHVVRLPGAPDVRRIETLLNQMLEARGLTGLVIDRAAGRYEYGGGPARCEVKLISSGTDVEAVRAAEMERQLTTAFETSAPFTPFRCFVIPELDRFSLGLAYFHAAGDAAAVAQLLIKFAEACQSAAEPAPGPPVELYPKTPGLLRSHPGVVWKRLLRVRVQAAQMRRSCRPGYPQPGNPAIRFTCFALAPDDLRFLIKTAKSWEVTLNDLFLALLLKCLSTIAPESRMGSRHPALSIGNIVNTRNDLGLDAGRTFGLFLGSYIVTHDTPPGQPLRELARDICRQTRAIKEQKLYLAWPLELALIRLALRFFSPARHKTFYQKAHPLWGGITNMNLNPLREPKSAGGPLDYLRGVSTGPATPLVLSITTMREIVSIGLSYRTTVFSPEQISRLQKDFLAAAGHLRRPE
jgi:hypothetical protein